MSRDLDDEDYYMSQGGIIPIKWTAPEVITYLHKAVTILMIILSL